MGQTKTYLLTEPKSFLFHYCYPLNLTFGTKTRFKGCTITAIKLTLSTHIVVLFLSTTVCTVVKKSVIAQGESKSPSGFLRAQPLNALSAISCMRNGVPVRHEHIDFNIMLNYRGRTFSRKSFPHKLHKPHNSNHIQKV